MLNLIAFKDQEKYGRNREEFRRSAGSRPGAAAKLVGVDPSEYKSIAGSGKIESDHQSQQTWDLVAFIHYPSILHFADMLSSTDYQEISQKYRTGILVDNPTLCLSEIGCDA